MVMYCSFLHVRFENQKEIDYNLENLHQFITISTCWCAFCRFDCCLEQHSYIPLHYRSVGINDSLINCKTCLQTRKLLSHVKASRLTRMQAQKMIIWD